MGKGTAESGAPLSAVHVLGTLAQSLEVMRLHAGGSPEVVNAQSSAYATVRAFLKDLPEISLAWTARGVRVNGRLLPPDAGARVPELLLQSPIHSVAIRRGCTVEEFLSFLEAVTERFWGLTAAGEITRRLYEEGVSSIRVYASETDRIREEMSGTHVAAPSLEEIERIEGAPPPPPPPPPPTPAPAARLVLVDTLPDDAAIEHSSGVFTLEKAVQAIGEIARVQQECKPDLKEALGRVVHSIAGAFSHDSRLAGFLTKLIGEASGDAADRPPSPEDQPPAAARAREILEMNPENQAAAIRLEGEALLRDLAALPRLDLAAMLMARLTGSLADRSGGRRAAAAEALLAIRPCWDSPPLSMIRDGFEDLVRSALDTEQDPEAYPGIAEIAAGLMDDRLRCGDFKSALETLAVLRRHQLVKDPAVPARREIAYRALERLAGGAGLAAVVAAARKGDAAAIHGLESFDVAVARLLVGQLRSLESLAERIHLAQVLSRMGPGAAPILAEEAERSTAPSDAIRLIEVLPYAAPESAAVRVLGNLLRHPAQAVRRRAAELMAEKGYARSGELILRALKDEREPALRASLAEALGAVRYAPAFAVLASMAASREETDAARSAACFALGRMGDTAAIPVLAEVCGRFRRGISNILRPTAAAVRLAAVRALGAMGAQEGARDVLLRASEDAEPTVRSAAREALNLPRRRTTVAAALPPDPPHSDSVKLAGSLREIPVDQVCQLIATTGKTGLLMFDFKGPAGRVYFEEGMVVAAEFEGRLDQEAFNAFIRKREGHFIFRPGEIAPQRRLRAPVTMILLESFRVTDEGTRAP